MSLLNVCSVKLLKNTINNLIEEKNISLDLECIHCFCRHSVLFIWIYILSHMGKQ